MKSFQPRRRLGSAQRKKSNRNKIAIFVLVIIIGLLVNNAVMSHDNKIQETEHLKEVA